MAQSAIGIDLGGTNLKGLIMAPNGARRHLTRIPTEAALGGMRVCANIVQLIDTLIEKEGGQSSIIGAGIGSPGFVDKDGTVLGGAENLPGWKGINIFDPIRERFGLPVFASNDVTLTALAESRFGAGMEAPNMLCFALGTGVGGGVVLNNAIYDGSHGMAGELGHIVVETNGLPCNCGQRGCVEQYASATAIAALGVSRAREAVDRTPFVEFAAARPEAVTSKTVYQFVARNDPAALDVHHTACEMLARACGIACNAFAPDMIVLGGGVLKAGEIIVREVSRRAAAHCWPEIWQRCDIVAAKLSEDAGVIGAASLVYDSLGLPCGPRL
jgi:glucokinase